jgi:hypothetical protein
MADIELNFRPVASGLVNVFAAVQSGSTGAGTAYVADFPGQSGGYWRFAGLNGVGLEDSIDGDRITLCKRSGGTDTELIHIVSGSSTSPGVWNGGITAPGLQSIDTLVFAPGDQLAFICVNNSASGTTSQALVNVSLAQCNPA